MGGEVALWGDDNNAKSPGSPTRQRGWGAWIKQRAHASKRGRTYAAQAAAHAVVDIRLRPHHAFLAVVRAEGLEAVGVHAHAPRGLVVVAGVAPHRRHLDRKDKKKRINKKGVFQKKEVTMAYLRGGGFASPVHMAPVARVDRVAALKIKPRAVFHVVLTAQRHVGPSRRPRDRFH